MAVGKRQKTEPGSDLEAIEVELFLLGLLRRYGYDLRGYDPDYVRTQVLRRMREEELDSVSRLSECMLRRPALLGRFLAQFSEGEGALFTPPDFWKSFRKNLVSYLRTYPSVRLWLVGGRAEDLYSLCILLEEDLPRNVRIFATDIHESLLDSVRNGVLSTEKIREGEKAYRRSGGRQNLERYFDHKNGSAIFSPALRKKVVFGSHNPVTDGSFQECHVILARNSLKLFSDELRTRALRLLHDSLVTLGFLALGPKDDLSKSPLKDCYKEVDRAARLYQKIRE